MRILGYCVAVATMLFLAFNGGEQATTTTLALSLSGIIASMAILAHSDKIDSNHD